jgi:hypothetical protein
MCTNTGNYRSPGRDNFCTDIGSEINGSARLGFCAIQDVAGNGYRTDLCRSLGGGQGNGFGQYDSGMGPNLWEWDFVGAGASGYYTSNTCGYDDFHDGQYFGSNGAAGCCNGPCAIAGAGYTCQRQQTLGNPLLCCLRDMNCGVITGGAGAQGQQYDSGPDACFETGAQYTSNDTFDGSNKAIPDIQIGRMCTCPASNRDQTSRTIASSGIGKVSYFDNASVPGGPHPVPEAPCYQVMTDWCTGVDLITGKPKLLPDGTYDNSWRSYWLSSATVDANCNVQNKPKNQTFKTPCLNYMYKLMYLGTPHQCTASSTIGGIPSTEGYALAQTYFSAMLTRYINEGGNLAVRENQVGDSEMNGLIWSICNQTPGLCSTALSNMCATMTTKDLIDNIVLQPWCGCHLPAAEYATYSNLYQINTECTPACNQKGTIPLASSDGLTGKTCNQSTCVIDNVAIELANAKVGGTGQGISFNQLCSNCGAHGVCNCTISNLTFVGVNAAIPGIDVSQQCGGSAQCYKQVNNATGVPSSVPVPCDQNINYNPYVSIDQENARAKASASNYQFLAIIGIFAAVVILLVFVWLIFRPRKIYDKDTLMFLRPKPTKRDVQIQKASTAAIGAGHLTNLGSTQGRSVGETVPHLNESFGHTVSFNSPTSATSISRNAAESINYNRRFNDIGGPGFGSVGSSSGLGSSNSNSDSDIGGSSFGTIATGNNF